MKTIELEILLMKHFDIRKKLIINNLTNWNNLVQFETDLLILTNTGFATGIEIKVSKADLKNDLKKDHIKYLDSTIFHTKTPTEIYYKNLKYFYYAVPEFLKDEALNQIPDFCGLLIAREWNDIKYIEEIKRPKHLFNKKWSDEMILKLSRLGTMRILGLKEKILKLENEIN